MRNVYRPRPVFMTMKPSSSEQTKQKVRQTADLSMKLCIHMTVAVWVGVGGCHEGCSNEFNS